MLKRLTIVAVLACLLSSGTAAQQNPLVIANVTTDASYLYISGVNFSQNPSVFLSGLPLSFIVNATGTQITASLPSVAPGTYLLHVSRGNAPHMNSTLSVAIGAIGPTGPAGATGPAGPAGNTGPEGPMGPAGPPGATGPAGATGATGAAGAAGPQGVQGPIGPVGPQGPPGFNGLNGAQGIQGIQGVQGATGAPGPIGPTGPNPFAGLTCPDGQVAVAFSLTEPIQVKCAVVAGIGSDPITPSTLQTYTPLGAFSVATVPFDPTNLDTPHPAYNGAPTIFKAIARGGNGNYTYEWDFDGDGVYDFTANTTNRYNLSAAYTYPLNYADVSYLAKVRVTSGAVELTAVYPVLHKGTILAGEADPIRSNPKIGIDVTKNYAANGVGRAWRKWMSDKAMEDGLWSLHNALSRSGNEADQLTGTQITGLLGTNGVASVGLAMSAMQARKHQAAYYPGRYTDATPTPTWHAENDARFVSDPYAEDLLRMFNYMLTQMQVVNVEAADEADDLSTPIAGTNDLFGLGWAQGIGGQGYAYYTGIAAAALAGSGLGGTLAQVGDFNRVLFKPIEFIAQQAVDYLVWFQNDAGSYAGSFYYSPNANADDASTSSWMYSGLHAMANSPMKARGLYVNNRVWVRIGSYVQQALRTVATGGSGVSYRVGPGVSFILTAAPLMAMGQMGWTNPQWQGSTAVPPMNAGFSLNVNPTRGMAYQSYRNVMTYYHNSWPGTVVAGQDYNAWFWGLWADGLGGYARDDDQYNLYAMSAVAKGFSAVGVSCIGGQETPDASGACVAGTSDWRHQITSVLVRRESLAPSGGTWLTPYVYNQISGPSISSMDPPMRNAMAVLTLGLSQ